MDVDLDLDVVVGVEVDGDGDGDVDVGATVDLRDSSQLKGPASDTTSNAELPAARRLPARH